MVDDTKIFPSSPCGQIRMILTDVDGVMTAGDVCYTDEGVEFKHFNVQDGFGTRLWIKMGYSFGIVTGRTSEVVNRRAADLGVSIVKQGILDKWPMVQEIAVAHGVSPEQICFIGDDFPDLPVIRRVGLGVTVPDSPQELRDAACYITQRRGGHGAVREVIEMILKRQNRWQEAIATYTK